MQLRDKLEPHSDSIGMDQVLAKFFDHCTPANHAFASRFFQ